MTSVAQAFGREERPKLLSAKDYEKVVWPIEGQLVGIEVEVEFSRDSRPTPLPRVKGWNAVHDGSLQDGVEYVLSNPMADDDLTRAIHSFFEAELPLKRRTTSSTHIHLDMLESETSLTSLQNLLAFIYVLEPAIFGAIDPSREWCGYTSPLESADVEALSGLLSERVKDTPSVFVSGSSNISSRYYGVNVQSLSKFGSLEFRYFPTASSAEELISWVKLAQNFKKAATSFVDVPSALEVFFDTYTYESFLDTFFSEWKDKILEKVSANRARRRAKVLRSKTSLEHASAMKRASGLHKVFSNGRFKKLIGVELPPGAGNIEPFLSDNGIAGYRRGDIAVFNLTSDSETVPSLDGEQCAGVYVFLLTTHELYIYCSSGRAGPGRWRGTSDTYGGPFMGEPIPISFIEEAFRIHSEAFPQNSAVAAPVFSRAVREALAHARGGMIGVWVEDGEFSNILGVSV